MANLPEGFLALFAGRDRAAAIYGDLTEIGAARGRVWFWKTYVCALATLGWRAPVAFVSGFTGFCLMLSFLNMWIRAPKAAIHVDDGSAFDKLALASTVFLLAFAMSSWFAAPYAALRFGHRDRMARLYGVLLLISTPVLLHSNSLSLACAALAVSVILAALFSPSWRKPMIVVMATPVAVIAALAAGSDLLTKVFHPSFHYDVARHAVDFNLRSWLMVRLSFAIALAFVAFVCSRLHDRMLSPGIVGGQNV